MLSKRTNESFACDSNNQTLSSPKIHTYTCIYMTHVCIFISGAVHDYQEVHNMPRRHTQVHNFLVNYRFQDLDIPFCYLKTTVIAIDSVFWFSKSKKAILLGECKTKFDQVEIPF